MIHAICIECGNRVVVDEEMTTIGISGMPECNCLGDERCAADDYTEDHRLDDPRHEPYSNLRSK